MSEGANGNSSNGMHAFQQPTAEACNCIVCMGRFESIGDYWCPACQWAWRGSIAIRKFNSIDPEHTSRRNSIVTSWAVTRRKEAQRDREVAKGCP